DVGFALASGLNFFFRVETDEEVKMRVGIEVTKLYYRFVADGHLEPSAVRKVSPLLAQLLSVELEHLRFEAIDGTTVFDSAVHERDERSDLSSGTIKRPVTMLCRVTSNGTVRVKAKVLT